MQSMAMASLADPNGTLDKIMKRKLKNRASAARSHARKQAYINQLEIEVSILREKLGNKQKEMESNYEKPPSSSDASIQNSPPAQKPLFLPKPIKTEPDMTHINTTKQALPSSNHVSLQNQSPTTQELPSLPKPIKTEPDPIHENTIVETHLPNPPLSIQNNSQTHVNNSEETEMPVDISTEETTNKRVGIAIAGCKVLLGEETFNLVATNQGDVLNVAKIAGIMGAKQTRNLIPFYRGDCSTTEIRLTLTLNCKDFAVEIEGEVVERSGGEMEAMTAVSVVGLTICDMCKGSSKVVRITDLCLKERKG